MDLAGVFPMTHVRLIREGRPGEADIYFVTRAAAGHLELEAGRASLSNDPPDTGEAVQVHSQHPDAMYVVKGTVSACFGGAYVTVRVTQKGEIYRVQRRKEFRVRTNCGVTLSAFEPPTIYETLDTITEDLSAGGFLFAASRPLPVGCKVKVEIHIPDGEPPVACNAEVMRAAPGPYDRMMIGMRFADLSYSGGDRITRYIMKVMRKTMNI